MVRVRVRIGLGLVLAGRTQHHTQQPSALRCVVVKVRVRPGGSVGYGWVGARVKVRGKVRIEVS